MKRYALRLFQCLLTVLLFVPMSQVCTGGVGWAQTLARMNVGVVGGGVPAAVGTISDNFDRTDGDSLGTNWTEASGDGDISSNAMLLTQGSYTANVMAYTGAQTGSISQYVKVTVTAIANAFPHIVLRYVNSLSSFYVVTVDPSSCVVTWSGLTSIWDGEQSVTFADLTCSSPFSIAVTVAGTGTDTVVRVWINPTNNTPTAIDGWDSAGDTADATLTVDPPVEANTGRYVGVACGSDDANGCTFDNFYGGSI